jgi:hypothetical protein
MKIRNLRIAAALALLVIACSSSRDEDEGCNIGKRRCTSTTDCEGFTTFFGPDKECSVISCGTDGFCKEDAITDTNLTDDKRGDCRVPRCDANGFVVQAVSKGDVGSSLGSSSCRRKKCVDGFLGGVSLEEVTELDGVRCDLEGDREGVCEQGVCMNAPPPPPPPPPPPKKDAGSDAGEDAGSDAGEDDDGGMSSMDASAD